MLQDLYTREGEALQGAPWQSYPRPQLKRNSYVNLNGIWDFAVSETAPTGFDRTIRVPFCTESSLSGVGDKDFMDCVWYKRTVTITEEQLEAALAQFRGEIQQIPPMYSALKINGQKLCDLARKGREVERQPRPITIHELTLLETTENTLRLRVRCSKGTYIRTLCKDIGEALGCGGCMEALRRVQAGV